MIGQESHTSGRGFVWNHRLSKHYLHQILGHMTSLRIHEPELRCFDIRHVANCENILSTFDGEILVDLDIALRVKKIGRDEG